MQIVKGAQIGVQIRKFEQNADFLKKLPGMCALHIFYNISDNPQYAGRRPALRQSGVYLQRKHRGSRYAEKSEREIHFLI